MLFMSENTLHRVIQCLFDQMHHELLHYTLNIHVHDTYSQSRYPTSTTITSYTPLVDAIRDISHGE